MDHMPGRSIPHPKGTPVYERSMGYYREMLPFAQRLHSSYVVFHHNNCKVLDVNRGTMLRTADENLKELTGAVRQSRNTGCSGKRGNKGDGKCAA